MRVRNWRLAPIIRSDELLEEGHKEKEEDALLENEIYIAPCFLRCVPDIPFEDRARPLKPIVAVTEEPSDYMGPLLEPASPLAERLWRQEHPFDEVQLICRVYDRFGRYRACIYHDGSVRNNRDELMGYLDLEDKAEAGSATEDFLGELETGALGHQVNARGPFGELVAQLDLGSTRIIGQSNSTVVEFSRAGYLSGNDGSRLGHFEPFDYSNFKLLSLYILFLDPGMISVREIFKRNNDSDCEEDESRDCNSTEHFSRRTFDNSKEAHPTKSPPVESSPVSVVTSVAFER